MNRCPCEQRLKNQCINDGGNSVCVKDGTYHWGIDDYNSFRDNEISKELYELLLKEKAEGGLWVVTS